MVKVYVYVTEVKVTILDRIEYREREDLVVPSEEEMLSSSSPIVAVLMG